MLMFLKVLLVLFVDKFFVIFFRFMFGDIDYLNFVRFKEGLLKMKVRIGYILVLDVGIVVEVRNGFIKVMLEFCYVLIDGFNKIL